MHDVNSESPANPDRFPSPHFSYYYYDRWQPTERTPGSDGDDDLDADMAPPGTHRRRKSSINPKRSASSTGAGSDARRPPRRLVVVLRAVWLATVLWVELGAFQTRIASCSWPISSGGKGKGKEAEAIRVLVVADPQLPSMGFSYPERGYVARWLSLKVIEQYLRKAWRMVLKSRRPDAVVFLGDLLDGGVEAVDRREYASYVHRFHRTFPSPSARPLSPSPHLLHLPGNHDLGLSPHTSASHSSLSRERFAHTWEPGRLNGERMWGNVSLVWVDAVGLVEERKQGQGPGEATNFVRMLSGSRKAGVPRVLLTHIPLHRPEGTACGPLRESPRPIRQGGGVNYQNEVDEELSRFVLEHLEPDLVLSGDDHDYCVVSHASPKAGGPLATEVTVKSFSMAMGVLNPGYLLLSLPLLPSSSTVPAPAYSACLLPSQLHLYLLYLPLFLLTLVLIFGSRAYRALATPRRVHARGNGLPMHGHRKSLSRSLNFLRPNAGDESDGDEGVLSDYGNYASPTRMTYSHAHHPSLSASIDAGRGGTILEDLEGGATFGDGRRPPRRVSRMFWENGSQNGGGGGSSTAATGGRSPAHPSPASPLDTLASLLQSLLRRLLGQSLARSVSRAGSKLRASGGKLARHPIVRGGCRDVIRTVWWGGAVWVLVWAWYWW